MFPFDKPKDFAKEAAEISVGCLGACITLIYRVMIGAAAVKILFFL